jgi:hypothetical protein
MLKILAWRDKHTAHARAATDLRSLISASLTGTAFPLQPARG